MSALVSKAEGERLRGIAESLMSQLAHGTLGSQLAHGTLGLLAALSRVEAERDEAEAELQLARNEAARALEGLFGALSEWFAGDIPGALSKDHRVVVAAFALDVLTTDAERPSPDSELAALQDALSRVEAERDQAKAELRASERLAVSESESRLRLTQRAVVAEAERDEARELLANVPRWPCDKDGYAAWWQEVWFRTLSPGQGQAGTQAEVGERSRARESDETNKRGGMMDTSGFIYELDDEQRHALLDGTDREVVEDVARLDGYLKARAEADQPNRTARRKAAKKRKKHGRS